MDSETQQLLKLIIQADDQASAVLEGLSARVLGVNKSLLAAINGSDLMVGAQVRLGGAMDAAGLSLGAWSKQTEGAVAESLALEGASMASATAVLGLAAGAVAVGGALVDAVGKAASFDAMLTQIQNNTTMTNADVRAMHDAILAMASDTGQSLDALAQGFMHVDNITQNATASTAILAVANQSAAATGADVSQVANILANTMHEYGLDVDTAGTKTEQLAQIQANATNVMGIMHLAAAESNMTLAQFAETAGTTIGTAANLHVPLADAAAAFSALTLHGFDAARANTQITDAFTHMINPTRQAKDALAALSQESGINLTADFSAAGLASKGLSGVIGDLQAAYAKLGYSSEDAYAATMKLIGAQRGGLGLATLLGTANGDYEQRLLDLTDTQKTMAVTQGAWNNSLNTLGTELAIAKASLGDVAMALGETFVPIVVAAISELAQFAQLLEEGVVPVLEKVRDAMDAIGQARDAVPAAVAAAIGPSTPVLGGLEAAAAAHPAAVNGLLTGATLGLYHGTAAALPAPEAAGQHQAAVESEVQKYDDAVQAAADQLKALQDQKSRNGIEVSSLNLDVRGVKAELDPQIKALQDRIAAMQRSVAQADAADKLAIAGVKDPTQNPREAQRADMQAALDAATQSTQQADAQDKVTEDGIKATYQAQLDPLQRRLELLNQAHQTSSDMATVEEDQIHLTYDAEARSLQNQLDALAKRNQYAEQTQAAENKILDARLQQAMIAAEGDPTKRAALEGRLATLDIQERKTELQKEIDTLSKGAAAPTGHRIGKYGIGATGQTATADDRAVNALKLQQDIAKLAELNLEDPAAVGKAAAAIALQGNVEKGQGLANQITDAGNALASIPLQQQLDGLKTQEQGLLDKITEQKEQEQARYDLEKSQLEPEIATLTRQENDALKPLQDGVTTRDHELELLKVQLEPAIKGITADEDARIKVLQEAIAKRDAEEKLNEGPLKDSIAALQAEEAARLAPLQAQLDILDAQNAALDLQIEKAQYLRQQLAADGTAPGDPTKAPYHAPGKGPLDGSRPDAPNTPPPTYGPGGTLQGPPVPPPGGYPTYGPGGLLQGPPLPPPGGFAPHVDAYHDAAATEASRQLGEHVVDRCEQFVDDVFGVEDRTGRGTAWSAAQMFMQEGALHTGDPTQAPVGARLYFGDVGPDGTVSGALGGHVAIKTAADTMVGSDDNGVEARQISTWEAQAHQKFLGWYLDPSNGGAPTPFGTGAGGASNGAPAAPPQVTIQVTVAPGAVTVAGDDGAGTGRLVGDTVALALKQLSESLGRARPGAPRGLPGSI